MFLAALFAGMEPAPAKPAELPKGRFVSLFKFARCSFEAMLPAKVMRRCAPPSAFKGAMDRGGHRLFEEAHFSRTLWVSVPTVN